ncbi:PAS domain-containing protein [Methylomonas sp. LL1]|nr:PAS domain-containing protein [Methylomonas sp. LL1]
MVVSLSPAEMTAHPNEKLLHELLVHKIELEMQNEELRKTYSALEEALDRYRDLYDFAPVGYISIDREDGISEVNLTAAALLGVDRDKLINLRFSRFVADQNRDHWHRLFWSLMESPYFEKQAFDLVMLREDGSQFQARLDCLRWETSDAWPMLRITLTEIGKNYLADNQQAIASSANL